MVSVFDLGSEPLPDGDGTQPFIVTELMSGGDVEGLIEEAPDHRMPMERAIQIALETVQGLEFAHEKGIVHRDLKPGNVWLTADGRAKIGDFGLAVAMDRSRLTQAGMMVGSATIGQCAKWWGRVRSPFRDGRTQVVSGPRNGGRAQPAYRVTPASDHYGDHYAREAELIRRLLRTRTVDSSRPRAPRHRGVAACQRRESE
ncbi:MAG: hypothetical protein EXR58_08835 [Chloroflexi bacterium]|nr:hypothetical protein [Chloroflexota bacterium]